MLNVSTDSVHLAKKIIDHQGSVKLIQKVEAGQNVVNAAITIVDVRFHTE